jgi:hypothetical protein
MSGNLACMGENNTAYRILMGKPQGKRLPGRRNIRRNGLTRDKCGNVVNTVMNFGFYKILENF